MNGRQWHLQKNAYREINLYVRIVVVKKLPRVRCVTGITAKKCRKKFTCHKGTVFDNSRLPLKKWLYAIYLLQTSRKGISSLQLSKELDVTQKTAWFLSHRLREACNLTVFPLAEIVEIDETYIGGKEANKHATQKKTP